MSRDQIPNIIDAYYKAHSSIAQLEGWDIFDAYGSVNGRWQIQRCDEMEVFASDQEAWAHVWQKSEEGSVVHRLAINAIMIENPSEYVAIMTYVNNLPKKETTSGS